ncbi:MAG: TPM domain-containing protein [Lachnospiraceae bacterium]|nr:TPM domain-containing protein [Lachnospiraceae bacterium]
MKKRALLILTMLLLIAFSSVSAWAATSNMARVTDAAEVLTSSEASELESRLDEASSKGNMDVIVITVPYIPDDYSQFGDDASEHYADDLYDYSGFAEDGILLMVCPDSRDFAISTKGRAIEVFTDSELSNIRNAVVPYLSGGNWSEAFLTFANEVATAKNFKFGLWLAIAAGLGALVGAIRGGSLKSQLKSVHSQEEASYYIKDGSFRLDKKFDIPTYRTVSRTKIERSSSSESTTHTSSSGATHGGTHGKF